MIDQHHIFMNIFTRINQDLSSRLALEHYASVSSGVGDLSLKSSSIYCCSFMSFSSFVSVCFVDHYVLTLITILLASILLLVAGVCNAMIH